MVSPTPPAPGSSRRDARSWLNPREAGRSVDPDHRDAVRRPLEPSGRAIARAPGPARDVSAPEQRLRRGAANHEGSIEGLAEELAGPSELGEHRRAAGVEAPTAEFAATGCQRGPAPKTGSKIAPTRCRRARARRGVAVGRAGSSAGTWPPSARRIEDEELDFVLATFVGLPRVSRGRVRGTERSRPTHVRSGEFDRSRWASGSRPR